MSLSSLKDEGAWDSSLKWEARYKIAFDGFNSKKSHLPTFGTMQKLLASFVFEPVDDFFMDPELVQAKAFVSIKTESKTWWPCHSKSAMDKRWTTAFVAQYLALLLFLCEQENKERENKKTSGKSLEDLSSLEKAFAA
jgi:hypothetical protein